MNRLLITENDPPMRLTALALGETPDERMQGALRRFFGPGWAQSLEALRGMGTELGLTGKLRPALATAAPLEAQLADVQVLFAEQTPVTAAAIGAAPRLRLIHTHGTGASHVDAAAARERGIAVKTLRRWVNTSVAEHALLLILAVARRLNTAHRAAAAPTGAGSGQPSAYNWADLDGVWSLRGKTLGIVGMGEIGRELALRAAPLQLRLLYTQRHRMPGAEEAALGAEFRPLAALLAESDIVSVHVPLSEATRHLIGAPELARMKRGAVLINTSRGRLVDEAALAAALQAGLLGGAGLDVRYDEPPAALPGLTDTDRVVLTPHVAAGTGAELLLDARCVLENVAAALR